MVKKIALYMRLSSEDEKSGESQSISSQRNLIKDFIINDNELIAYKQVEYVDDGYSGYNLNRPSITKLIEEVRANEIYCIIVKDISRFGRNNLEILPYIEKIFPFMGVRFISISDNFDTSNKVSSMSDINISIKSIVNDFYVKDLSKKRKSSCRVNAENGIYTTGSLAYGYKRDEKDRHRIVIDEYSARIVEKIFEYVINGLSTGEVAKKLNQENIITPSEYKRRYIFKNNKATKNNNVWTNIAVTRILKNEIYTGTFIAYKREYIGINSKLTVANKEEDWVKIKGNHIAIIDEKTFNYVNEICLPKNKRRNKNYKDKNIFARKLYCGYCGKTMRNNDRNRKYYYCVSHRYTENKPCFENAIPKIEVEKIVLSKLKEEAKKVKVGNSKAKKQSKVRKVINSNYISKLESLAKKNFENYMKGSIDEIEFKNRQGDIESEIAENKKGSIEKKEINKNIKVIDYDTDCLELQKPSDDMNVCDKIINNDGLTREMMVFVKKINIFGINDIEVEIDMNK